MPRMGAVLAQAGLTGHGRRGAVPAVPVRNPEIVGIVNVTADSFSDGGCFLDPLAALAHARGLVADGAAVIDVGPASSRPGAQPILVADEIRRLEGVVPALVAAGVVVSVDSFQPDTQRWALGQGVAWLNDIQGFPHPELYPELARATCRLVVMHSVQRLGPATRVAVDPDAVWDGMLAFFDERLAALVAAGVAAERLIVDPGMGQFLGTGPEASVRVLRQLPALRARWGRPILVSVSRKSFLGNLTGRPVPERGPATLAAELFAAGQGVDYVRTHDVRALRDALAVLAALEE